eukprot:2060848-Amphidinium_carterae.1
MNLSPSPGNHVIQQLLHNLRVIFRCTVILPITRGIHIRWDSSGADCLRSGARGKAAFTSIGISRGTVADSQTQKQVRAAEDDEAVGGMRRPALSLLKVPGLIPVGRKLRAVLAAHMTAWARDDIVAALMDHKEPERLQLMLTRIWDELLEALGSRSIGHTAGASGPY